MTETLTKIDFWPDSPLFHTLVQIMDVMPTHLIFMENNYLFYAQQLWTVSCLRAKASVRYSVLKCFLVHYSIVLFYYTVAECVPLNFRVSEIFRAFFPEISCLC